MRRLCAVLGLMLLCQHCTLNSGISNTFNDPSTLSLPPVETLNHPEGYTLSLAYRLAHTPQWRTAVEHVQHLQDPSLEPYAQLIQSMADIEHHRRPLGCQRLLQLNSNALLPHWHIHYLYTKAHCQAELHQLISSLNTLQLISAQHDINDPVTYWNIIYSATPSQLQKADHFFQENPIIRGWIELGFISKIHDINDHNQRLDQWKVEYPDHPAQALISTSTLQWSPRTIGLLLPSQGPLSSAAKAIQQGIMTAVYATPSAQRPTTVHTYDTSQHSLKALLQKAQQDHVDIFIGPLAQQDIETLAQLNPTIPVIALNTTPTNHSKIFELNMRAEDEGQQMAHQAFKRGLRHALLISTPQDKHTRIRSGFIQQWSHLGGTLADDYIIMDHQNLMAELRKHLGITESEARAHDIKTQLNLSAMKYIPQRRQDIDTIILAVNHDEAKKIAPLIKYFYSGDLPIYATSSIYHQTTQRFRDHDLDGITFGDTPWIAHQLAPSTQKSFWSNLPQALKQIWPQQFSTYSRFYAIGIDAYQLAFHLPRLIQYPYAYLNGATGQLYLDSKHHIQRRLTWIHLSQGRARLASNMINSNGIMI